LGGARASAVLAVARRARITLYASEYIFAEVAKILDAKFYWPPARVQDAFTGMRGYVIIVPPGSRRISVVRDPKDNPILECAQAARAKYLITGDRDLLTLGTYRRLRIVTLREFLNLYPPPSAAAP
jgi:putative PIN family toxin of toxin-antitoxin system